MPRSCPIFHTCSTWLQVGLLLALAARGLALTQDKPGEKLESGRYLYASNGRPAGSESFSIRTDERGVVYAGTAELLNGRLRIKQNVELAVDARFKTQRFIDDARVNGQRTRVQVEFGDDGAQWRTDVEDRTEVNRVTWPQDQLLIADNIIHHLTALARRYNTSKPEIQIYARTLSGVQPSVELVGQKTIPTQSAKEIFFQFRILIGDQRLYVWTNRDNLVIKAVQPDRHFEAVLEGWEPYASQLGPHA